MGTFSFWHWLIVLLVILIIFGAGKLPKVAGDLAQGIKNFRKGMQDGGAEDEAKPKSIDGGTAAGAPSNANLQKDKAAQS